MAQNTRDHFLAKFQNIAFSDGNRLFAGDFCANLDETNSIYKEMELEMDFLTSRILLQKALELQMSTIVCASRLAGLSSGQNIKKKDLDTSYSNQNVETTCNSKLKFTELKDLFIKIVQKN